MDGNLLTKVRKFTAEMRFVGDSGLPMRFRLFCFFLLFLIAIMLGVMIILSSSGIFVSGRKEVRALLEHGLVDTSNSIYQDYGNISVQSVELARNLSASLERKFSEHGITATQLQSHPELLEVFLEEELGLLTSALIRTRSSGVFLILDATVNPELGGAEHSRAGLFIKNMEPNIVSSSFSNLRFLRGPMTVARNNDIDILPQWKMEFEVEKLEGYAKTIQTAKGSALPLSRLYYWSQGMSIANSHESAMLCNVPLIDAKGRVFGICGFEVSAMLFKLSYSPNYAKYSSIFCMFSRVEESSLNVNGSLFAGSYRPLNLSLHPLSVHPGQSFTTYRQTGSASFVGLHQYISLYPKDSAYQEEWMLALMMPEQDLAHVISGRNRQLFMLLALLTLVSIALSSAVSRRFIKPVVAGLNLIKADKLSQVPKTRIPEIDDLIKFLAEQDEDAEVDEDENTGLAYHGETRSSSMYNRFMENIDTLSTAERAVFNLYLKGYTAKEIADILCLSINTIKTHNKRIYMKLNISSRKELLLYIEMMEEQRGPDAPPRK